MSSSDRSEAYSRSTISAASWNSEVRRRIVEARCMGTYLDTQEPAQGMNTYCQRARSGALPLAFGADSDREVRRCPGGAWPLLLPRRIARVYCDQTVSRVSRGP